jgi:hypothetical protein
MILEPAGYWITAALDIALTLLLFILICLLAAVGLTPGGSSTLHIYTHTQYVEQHKETEYTEQNIPNNKNP